MRNEIEDCSYEIETYTKINLHCINLLFPLFFQVLIEFDDIEWTRREWVRIHDIFQLFLVEHTLVWAERPDPDKPKQSISWPGLVSNN